MILHRLKTKKELNEGIEALTAIFIEEYPFYSTWIQKNMSQFESGEKIIFRIEDEQQVIGYMMVHLCSDRIAKINGLYVFEEFKGVGYASESIKELTKLLILSNVDSIYVQTRLDNNAVVHLFDKNSYELIGNNYHEIEKKDNWVACYSIQNNRQEKQEIASSIYDGFIPLSIEEVGKLRNEHKLADLVLKLKRKED